MIINNHILVTRYSLKSDKLFGGLTKKIIENDQVRNTWIKDRNILFTKYCMPSILRQHLRPLKWLLLMDETDTWVPSDIGIDKYDWIVPCFIPSGESSSSTIQDIAKDIFSEGNLNELKISRVDNDDMLSMDYFESINDFNYHDFESYDNNSDKPFVLVSPIGVRWNGISNVVFNYETPPFLTYIYSGIHLNNKKFTSPFDINHVHVTKHPHAVVDSRTPQWLQVIHQNNLSNEFEPKGDVIKSMSVDELNDLFGILQ
jgi:hypothetical protein